jgi:hypothetical protein
MDLVKRLDLRQQRLLEKVKRHRWWYPRPWGEANWENPLEQGSLALSVP